MIPKYLNCSQCGIARIITEKEVPFIQRFGIPDSLICERCNKEDEEYEAEYYPCLR